MHAKLASWESVARKTEEQNCSFWKQKQKKIPLSFQIYPWCERKDSRGFFLSLEMILMILNVSHYIWSWIFFQRISFHGNVNDILKVAFPQVAPSFGIHRTLITTLPQDQTPKTPLYQIAWYLYVAMHTHL